MPKYEYAALAWIYETNYNEIRQVPAHSRPEQTWTSKYTLWLPYSAKAEELSGDIPVVTLLNDLGKDGWELVASAILDSAIIAPGWYGWPELGVPVRRSWTFMRET